MRQLGHTYVDILKVDIEGSERGLVNGLAHDGFNWSAVGQLLIETHGATQNVLPAILQQTGADFVPFHNGERMPSGGSRTHARMGEGAWVAGKRMSATLKAPRLAGGWRG
eukprot:scaffold18847_cov129-Isochrysis_galbana.AAC.1